MASDDFFLWLFFGRSKKQLKKNSPFDLEVLFQFDRGG